MKTQVFHLEDYDDILSARDQIGWSKASRILLVFPDRKKPGYSLTDYVLLAREANRLGAAAAFILRDRSLRNQLETLGLLCFRSIREANHARWRTGRRMKKLAASDLPFKRASRQEMFQKKTGLCKKQPAAIAWKITAFILAVTAIMMVILLFIPRTRITLQADRQIQEYKFLLQGDLTHATAPYSGIIHVYPNEFSLENEIWTPASDEINLAIDHASGFVDLYNLTNQTLAIPEGLVVTANMDEPVRFETSKPTTLMAGYGSKQTVPIKAIKPGESGNVPTGVIITVEGEWANFIQAVINQATDGGTSMMVSSPTENDLKLARKLLLERLDGEARIKTGDLIQSGQVLVDESIKRQQILLEQIVPDVGQPAEELHLLMKVNYAAWYMMEDDLTNISNAMLDVMLPQGYTSSGGALEFDFSNPVRILKNGFETYVQISRQIESEFEAEQIFTSVAGLNPFEAGEKIAGLWKLSSDPVIELQPAWWPIMPIFRYQYEIIGK